MKTQGLYRGAQAEETAPTRACGAPVLSFSHYPCSVWLLERPPQVGLAWVHLDAALKAGLLVSPLLEPTVRCGRPAKNGCGRGPEVARSGGLPSEGPGSGCGGGRESRTGFGGVSPHSSASFRLEGQCCCCDPVCAASLSGVPAAGLAFASRCPVPSGHRSWRLSGVEDGNGLALLR